MCEGGCYGFNNTVCNRSYNGVSNGVSIEGDYIVDFGASNGFGHELDYQVHNGVDDKFGVKLCNEFSGGLDDGLGDGNNNGMYDRVYYEFCNEFYHRVALGGYYKVGDEFRDELDNGVCLAFI